MRFGTLTIWITDRAINTFGEKQFMADRAFSKILNVESLKCLAKRIQANVYFLFVVDRNIRTALQLRDAFSPEFPGFSPVLGSQRFMVTNAVKLRRRPRTIRIVL